MQKLRKLFFPKPEIKILKSFGPAFLVIALGIGSGEFILWPYLSAHYGFGILWGALLGISVQLIIIVALERHTAFLGEDALASFSRVFKYAFSWIVFSTIIGFGWPGFSAMAAQLLTQGLSLSLPQNVLSFIILILAAWLLLIGKNSYKKILILQKINMGILLILISFLFIYYFDISIFVKMFQGLVGMGEQYVFVPAGISLLTFMGAIAYAGSGGNLLLMNSFYVEREGKGLIPERKGNEVIIPDDSVGSIKNTKLFTKSSWKQNTLFFWGTGLMLISMLAYISYAVLYGSVGLPEDFTFLIREAAIFSRDIHPIIGSLFIISGSLALFGVQLGILDFMGRIAGNKPGLIDNSSKQKKYYRFAVIGMIIFAFLIFAFGFSQPHTLIIIGSTLNAFAMGVIAYLLYRVERRLIPAYLSSKFFSIILPIISIFYLGFFFFTLYKHFM